MAALKRQKDLGEMRADSLAAWWGLPGLGMGKGVKNKNKKAVPGLTRKIIGEIPGFAKGDG